VPRPTGKGPETREASRLSRFWRQEMDSGSSYSPLQRTRLFSPLRVSHTLSRVAAGRNSGSRFLGVARSILK